MTLWTTGFGLGPVGFPPLVIPHSVIRQVQLATTDGLLPFTLLVLDMFLGREPFLPLSNPGIDGLGSVKDNVGALDGNRFPLETGIGVPV